MPRGKKDRDSFTKPPTRAPERQAFDAAQRNGRAATGDTSAYPGSESVVLDAHLDSVFDGPGYTLRVRTDADGRRWYKCEIRTTAWPRHYTIVSHPRYVPFTTGLRQLTEKVYQVQEGTLRPSPDN